jgi:mono/diheme cytochrome c family protein
MMKSRCTHVVFAFALVTSALAGCGKNNEAPAAGTPTTRMNGQQESGPKPSAPSTAPVTAATGGTAATAPGTDAATTEARALFSNVCAVCHGATGKGDGTASASLNPKPRNYADAAWQKTVTDDEIRKAILLGGAGVGKSMMMPANPQLQDQPKVVDALVKLIRGFGQT